MSVQTKGSKTFNFAKAQYSGGQVKWRPVKPASNETATFSLEAAANTTRTMTIPAGEPWYSGLSRLKFDLAVKESSGRFLKVFMNRGPITRLALGSQSNPSLIVDLRDANLINKCIRPMVTRVSDFRKKGPPGSDAASADAARLKGTTDFFNPSNALVTAPITGLNSQKLRRNNNLDTDGYRKQYDGVMELLAGNAADVDVVLACVIEFADIPHCLLNKMSAWPSVGAMTLTVEFGNWHDVGFTGTAAATAAGYSALTEAPEVQNLVLEMAYEANLEAASQLRAPSLEPVLFPHTLVQRNVCTNQSGTSEVFIKAKQGMRLHRIYYWFQMTNPAQFRSSYNLNGDILTSHNVFIDHHQYYQKNLESAKASDFEAVRHLISGNVAGQSLGDFYANGVQCIDFTGIDNLAESKEVDYMVAGEEINGSLSFSVDYTLNADAHAAGVTLYTVAVLQKSLQYDLSGGVPLVTVQPDNSGTLD